MCFFTLRLGRYMTISSGNVSMPHRTNEPEHPGYSSVRVYGITETGNLHILSVHPTGILLQHIIPSMRMVSSGSSCTSELILASVMEVCASNHFLLSSRNSLFRTMTL